MSRNFSTPLCFRFARSARALTMLELVVAMLITLTIMGAVVGTIVQVLRLVRGSEARLEAIANARAAVESMSVTIKEASRVPGLTRFVGINVTLDFGDGIDNDGDGLIDEEIPNGFDTDGDWTPAGDRHATFQLLNERPGFVGRADRGDGGVDEDVRFSRDILTVRRIPLTDATYRYEDVTYEISDFEGRSHVLLRRSERLMTETGLTQATVAPLAYNVLSMNFLYWNPNALPDNQYWLEEWDSAGSFPEPGFELPASVAIDLIVYADTTPFESYIEGQPVLTETIRTMVNIESVIQDVGFPRRP